MAGPALVLVPTDLERRVLEGAGLPGAICVTLGFGIVAAALRTVEEIHRHRPSRVVLAGLAGTFDGAVAPVGTALECGAVALDGLGAGEGEDYLGLRAIGFPQLAGGEGRDAVYDELPLRGSGGLLLTVAAASAGDLQVTRRRRRWPGALAEDMEGFSVALASARAGLPCRIVRGISNLAGERDAARWRVPAALQAARDLLLAVLGSAG